MIDVVYTGDIRHSQKLKNENHNLLLNELRKLGQCLKSKRVASREVGGERVIFSCKLVKGLLQEDKQAKYGIRLLKVIE